MERNLRNELRWSSAVLFAAAALATVAHAQPPALTPELEATRAALAKYADPILAVRDGYFSLGCVEYPQGGMGVHFSTPPISVRCPIR